MSTERSETPRSEMRVSTIHTLEGKRKVENLIAPAGGFKSVDGFYVIAHRGASHYAPENTISAFEKAYQMKSDMIELDVLLSKDGVPVVIHDDTLNRTTNGRGAVSEFNFRELMELDAGSWFHESFKNTRIPSLETVMRWARDKISLNIEIKGNSRGSENSGGVEGAVLKLIKKYEMFSQVVISSFNKAVLHRIHEIEPRVITALLIKQYSYGSKRSFRVMKNIGANGLNLLPRQMNKSLMRMLTANHIPTWVYTVDNEPEMRRVIGKGATGIFTNRPDLLRSVALDTFI